MRNNNCERFLNKTNNFRQLLGIQIEEVKGDTSVILLPFKKQLLQPANIIHGGVLSTLIDAAVGTAIRSVIHADQIASTAEMNINYIRPATKGSLRAVGRVVHKGNTIIVGKANIFNENEKLIATGRATYVVKKKKVDKNE